MSFGFSVGDFLTVIELTKRIRKEFIGAPSQFKHISNEVRILSIVLEDADDIMEDLEPKDLEQVNLKDIVDSCLDVLNELKRTLDKYTELGSKQMTISKKAKRAWKQLTWEPEDIRDLRNRINTNIITLSTFITKSTRDNSAKLVQHQENEEQQAILNWLTPSDYTSQRNDFISRRQAGTGQWLLDSKEFKEWLDTDKQSLFCPGIPGAGKTVLASIVIEELLTRFQDDKAIRIAYLYCNFKQQDQQKIEDLLASLLKQLARRGHSSLPESVRSLYDKHKENGTRPSVNEISRILQSVAVTYSRVFIVVDALDECRATDGCRKSLLSEIFDLQTKCGVKVFATSRYSREIENYQWSITLEIRASEHDVQKYIDGHLPHLPSFVECNQDLQEEIKITIVKAVDGMFLLAKLHLDSLVGKTTPKAVRKALTKLSTGSEAYDHAYDEAMKRIEGQLPDHEELAKRVLSWITCAKRPLTKSELRHALAVEVGEAKLDEENLPEIENMVSVCAGLVTVDEESSIVRLVHYTTQQYFERKQSHWLATAEADISANCVTYLSFDVFKTGFCMTDSEFEERLRLNKFYDYAAHYWGHHLYQVPTVSQAVVDFLDCDEKVAAANQAMLASKSWSEHSNYSQEVPKLVKGLHLAAYFGLTKVSEAVLQNIVDADAEDEDGRTPLSYAAGNGHEAVVKLLLSTGKAEADSKAQDGRTPLRFAAENGHEAVVKLLLGTGKVEADSKCDKIGRTPLWYAVKNGHEAVVKLLLDTGKVEIEVKSDRHNFLNKTPLLFAAENGHEAIVKLLLDTGKVKADSKNYYGLTPLWFAAAMGQEAVVKLLLDTSKVDADLKDKEGRTPLSLAAQGGHEAVVKLLLDTGKVDADSKDKEGRTPLSYAAGNGHEPVVKLLQQNIVKLPPP